MEEQADLTALCSNCHEAAHTRTPKTRKKGPPAERHRLENLTNADFIENARRKQEAISSLGYGKTPNINS